MDKELERADDRQEAPAFTTAEEMRASLRKWLADARNVPVTQDRLTGPWEKKNNYQVLRSLPVYELAMVMNNIQEHLCTAVCPRELEDRCNDDCNNGLTEWLVSDYDPASPVWERN